MKRSYRFALAALAIAAALCFWAGAASSETPLRPLAQDMPRGAILYLEAKDFSGLLQQWNASEVKQAWLKSDNYKAFSLSRLALRLQQAQKEFAAAAGVPPDAKFLSKVAGKDSALALYDIGKLQFLYISRMPSSSAMQSALWQARGKFQSRSAAGATFFVHTDPHSGRVVAFAFAHGCLLVATREDLLAGALRLLAAGNGTGLAGEGWYKEAIASTGAPGELRLVLNMAKVAATPYFRSYWIQRNVSGMRQYEAAISDFSRNGSVYREDRVLLRKQSSPSASQPAAAQAEDAAVGERQVASLLRLIPSGTGFYRAEANPGAAQLLALLKTKILFPHTGPPPAGTSAPSVMLTGGVVGQESDLETRIDVPPPVFARKGNGWGALRTVLQSAGVQAALLLQSSAEDADTAFIQNQSAVVLATKTDWNADAVRRALAGAIRQEITTAGLGVGWKQAGGGSSRYSSLDGLLPVALAVRGHELILSNHPATLTAILERVKDAPSAEPAAYAAGFSHRAESGNFARLAADLDSSLQTRFASPGAYRGVPAFFSGNLVSLSRVLSGVESESIVVRDVRGTTRQTVIYRWER